MTGTFDLRATSGAITSTIGRFVAQANEPPQILSLSRTSGPLGVLVTATGTNFAESDVWSVGGVVVMGQEVPSSTTARFVIPYGTTGGAITCSNGTGTGTAPTAWTLTTDRYAPRVWMPVMCHYNDTSRMVELLPGYAASLVYAVNLPPTQVVIGDAGSEAANRAAFVAAFEAAKAGTGPRRIRISRAVDYADWVLDGEPAPGQWIYIEADSVATGELRAEGQRVAPDDAALLAVASTAAQATAAIDFGENARRIRLVGIHARIRASALPAIRTAFPRNGNIFSVVGLIGFNRQPGSTPRAGTPRDIIIDRCLVQGDLNVSCARGILANIDRLAILDTTIRDIGAGSFESHGILATSCAGRHVIRNVDVQSSLGISTMIGGNPSRLPELVPKDVFYDRVVRRVPANYTAAGAGAHKALLEVKHAKRVCDQRALYRDYVGNTLGQDNCVNIQTQDQDSAQGTTPYARTEDVIVRFSDAVNCTRWMTLNAYGTFLSDTTNRATRRIDVRHNRFLETTQPGGGSILVEQGRTSPSPAYDPIPGEPEGRSLTDLWIEDNTAVSSAPAGGGYPSNINYGSTGTDQAIRHTIRDNVLLVVGGIDPQDWQVARRDAGPLPGAWTGLPKVDCVASGNGLAPASASAAAALGSVAVASVAAAGVNANGSLQPSSPFKGIARDGGDPGADIARLETAIATVLTGRN